MARRVSFLLAVVAALAALGGCRPSVEPTSASDPVVPEPIALFNARPNLRDALTRGIDAASVQGIGDLAGFYQLPRRTGHLDSRQAGDRPVSRKP